MGSNEDYFAAAILVGTHYERLPAEHGVSDGTLSRGGLPIGIQAVGAAYRDHRTIEFARLMAERTGRIPGADVAGLSRLANPMTASRAESQLTSV